MGSCSNDYCTKIKPHEHVAEFSNEINNKTGFSYCMESCGCFHCGCFLCTPACLFYRIIPDYTSTNIYEVFSCSTFDTKINVSITLNLNNHEPQQTRLLLSPGQIVKWNNISFNLVSTSLPHLPLLGNSYLRDITSNQIRLLPNTPTGQPQVGMIGQLQCKSKSDAQQSNCFFDPNVCKCHSSGETVNCHCTTFNHSNLFLENEFVLPLSLGNLNLRTDTKNILIAEVTSSVSVQLQITTNNFKTITKNYNSLCNISVSDFHGCYHCHLGAIGNVTCITDFGDNFAILQCTNQHFTIKCTPKGYTSQITLYSPSAFLKEECLLLCPKNNLSFIARGHLQYVPSTIISHDHQYQSVTETYYHDKFITLPFSLQSLQETLNTLNPIANTSNTLYPFFVLITLGLIIWISIMIYPVIKLITSYIILYPIYKSIKYSSNSTSLNTKRKNI